MKKFIKVLVCLLLAFTFTVSISGVNDVSAASVKLSATKKTVNIGKSFTLSVKNYKKKSGIKWSTSNKTIASIKKINTKSYKVTGVKAGTATVTAKIGKKKYNCKVTVKSIFGVNTKNITMNVGETKAVEVTLIPDNYDVEFNIANDNIALGEWEEGWHSNNKKTYLYLDGMKAGKTTVTITNDYNNEKAVVNITVKSIMNVDTRNFVVKKGTTRKLETTLLVDDEEVTCYDGDEDIYESYWDNHWHSNNQKIYLNIKGLEVGRTSLTITNSYNDEAIKVNIIVIE